MVSVFLLCDKMKDEMKREGEREREREGYVKHVFSFVMFDSFFFFPSHFKQRLLQPLIDAMAMNPFLHILELYLPHMPRFLNLSFFFSIPLVHPSFFLLTWSLCLFVCFCLFLFVSQISCFHH